MSRLRHILAVACLAVAGGFSPVLAQAASLPASLLAPARITPRATQGLFVSVTRAGTRLVAVGEQGRILYSDDNGVSWHQVPVPTSVTLTGVAFATPQDGWAIGQMGVILHTQDGGKSWNRVFDGAQANQMLVDAAAADLKAQPDNQTAQANMTAAKQFVAGGLTVPFLSLLPLSASDVIAAGGFGMAFESHDGGKSWASIFDSIPNPSGFNIYALLPSGGDLYFIGEQGFLARRGADGSFTALTTPATGTIFGGLTAKGGALILYGLQGTVIYSDDQAAHWATIPTGVTAGIDAGVVLGNGQIILGDTAGDLLLSKDGGKNFAVAAQAGEPVAGLAQAANGDLIIAGPRGLTRMAPARIQAGV